MADFDIIEATTLAALGVTFAAFCTLGRAYVRFLAGQGEARTPAA